MIKQKVLILVVVIIFIIESIPVFALEQNKISTNGFYDYYKVINIIIGEKQAYVNSIASNLEQPAYIKKGSTLVPLRFITESFGAQVGWNSKTKQVNIKLGDISVYVTIGSLNAYVNGVKNKLNMPPEVVGGKTFVPIRFISEAFGANVDFDKETKTVEIDYVDESNWNKLNMESIGEFFYYPSDWEAILESETVAKFTSPKGSVLTLAFIGRSPTEMNDTLKEDMKNGWLLDYEELFTEGKMDDGFNIDFKYIDGTNEILWDFIYVYPSGNGSYISDQQISNENINYDWYVMMKISDLR